MMKSGLVDRMTRLRLVGSDHRLAPPSLLQRLSARAESIQARLLELSEQGTICGALLVSTCNRFEVLLELPNGDSGNDDSGNDGPEIDVEDLLGNDVPVRTCHDQEAVEVLLGVAAGLHSMVFGEEQILGQVREAFRQAEELGLLSRRLQMLRTRLLPAARDLRRRTGIDHRPPSVASMAVDQLLTAGKRFAVVGAGATGRLLLEILHRRHVRDVLVVNRSLPRAEALAQHFGGRAMSLHEFQQQRPELDGVVYAVRSAKTLLDQQAAQGLRMVVDISQPSVLDPDLRSGDTPDRPPHAPQVLTLDELSAVAATREQEYAATRDLGVVEARALAHKLWDELASRKPNLGRVVDLHVEGALAELERAFSSQLRHLEDPDRERLRALLVRTARRNAHFHIQDLKKLTSVP